VYSSGIIVLLFNLKLSAIDLNPFSYVAGMKRCSPRVTAHRRNTGQHTPEALQRKEVF
jgi:hypothetical protein